MYIYVQMNENDFILSKHSTPPVQFHLLRKNDVDDSSSPQNILTVSAWLKMEEPDTSRPCRQL